MSSPTSVPLSNGSIPAPKSPELDVTKLQALPSEQQDLYLLTFTADLARHCDLLDDEAISAEQANIKTQLLQTVTLPSPAPTRVIRNNVGRCYAALFRKGNRKVLYESLSELLGLVNGAAKAEKDISTKHAAVHCLGAIFEVAGDSVVNVSLEIMPALLRLLKSHPTHAGLRSSAFRALTGVISMMGPSLDEGYAREVWKYARNLASSDKASIVRISAIKCLAKLVSVTSFFDNGADFDSLKSSIWKTMDTPVVKVRHAAASCLAIVLVKAFVEESSNGADLRLKKLKKQPTRKQSMSPEDDQDNARSDLPAQKKATVRLSLGLLEILKTLSSQYIRAASTHRLRASIVACYTRVLKSLDERVIRSQYLVITDHLLVDLLSQPSITSNRYRLLTTRKYIRILLEDVVGREILDEAGQQDAVMILANNILKNYPAVIKERLEPSKYSLTAALSALASLLRSLGSAVGGLAEACREGLFQVLQHLSYTVQVATAHCLRELVLACPQQLLPCLSICMSTLQRELNLLQTARHSSRKCVGWANGLAAVLSIAPQHPLYGSLEVNARILALATDNLKASTKSELRISGTQIQVAWILIGGLMSLGPNFVKIHVSQLLLLWRNALPKPPPTDSSTQRSLIEWSFLAHVRECALGSILAFLESNSRLLTADMSKRIAGLLQNTSAFLDSLPRKNTTEDLSQRLSPSLQLYDLDLMVRRRVLQCYTKLVKLSPAGGSETLLHTNLVTLAMSSFADPNNYTPSSMSTSIANSAGSFDSVWEIGDNIGFGVTGMVCGLNVRSLPGEHGLSTERHWMTREGTEAAVDQSLLTPVVAAREHDSISLYSGSGAKEDHIPDPPATEVVNSAINLFAISLPMQPPKIQESILEQMATFLAASSLHRDTGRRSAMTVNVAVALLSTLQVASRETSSEPGDLRGAAVEKIMQEMLRNFVIHPDPYVRNIACEAIGRLCSSAGNVFTTNEIKHITEVIVSNRDPNARAGCAVALGCIHAQVGGMAAGFHLRNIFGILMSLIKDPHPTVHFWALEGLVRVVDSAGLTFSALVSGSLGMLAQIYVTDSHNEEAASTASSNLEVDWPTVAANARCLDSLINVLGPDLQDMSKARDLIMTLVNQFQTETNTLVLLAALRGLDHLSLYASGHMDFADYVRRLHSSLASPQIELRDAAVDGLYNLMKRDPEDVIKVAGEGLEEQLWLILDDTTDHDGIQNILRNWLQQTSLTHTSRWIQRCQDVLDKTRRKTRSPVEAATTTASGMPDLRDEEVAGFASAAGETSKDDKTATAGSGQQPLRWQVRMFAMSCLSDLLGSVRRGNLASEQVTAAGSALQKSLAEVIRMAFSASTSTVVELRVWGLRIIDQVLKIFGRTPDPDFAEVSLLEQYQAQISSALTPAFTADSSPELASEAINVCAAFIATGIVTDVDRMGRILKLLVSALINLSGKYILSVRLGFIADVLQEGPSENVAIGDLQGLSSNAQVMVRMAVYSAWAELQVASVEQKYLVEVVRPHLASLTPLWLASLKEFARLRFEPDISMSTGPASASDDLDTIYSSLNRDTLLKFYQDSWLKLVDAIASLIEQDSALVFDALDGKTESSTSNGLLTNSEINYRDEPVAFFFVLFGITFEALIGRSTSDSLASKAQTLEVLLALKKILHPSVSGQAIYQEVIFSETMDLLDRLVLTEGLAVQAVIVGIARNLCLAHPSGRTVLDGSSSSENLSEEIDQLFELTRIIFLVLAGLLPNLSLTNGIAPRREMSDEVSSLIELSLGALVESANMFPTVIRTDLHACIFHVFATILGTASCQQAVVPQALPILKTFMYGIALLPLEAETSDTAIHLQMRSCLGRFLAILRTAKRREAEASVACEKNTLLACTILLISGAPFFSPGDKVVIRVVDEMIDCLLDLKTGLVTASCIRSLLLHQTSTPPSNTPNPPLLGPLLFPRLLLILTTSPTSTHPSISSTAECLTTYTSLLSSPLDKPALSILIPALLHRASTIIPIESQDDPCTITTETAQNLLRLATAHQASFRAVLSSMSPDQRTLLQRILRKGAHHQSSTHGTSSSTVADDKEAEQPRIVLKMDFGM